MIPAIKAEFRKVATVRSTYVILALCVLIELIFAMYASGIKASAVELQNPRLLSQQVLLGVAFVSTILSLVGVLLVTHEYRYSTILYTFTASRRRSSVFLAKFIVISIFALLASLVYGFMAPVLADIGIKLAGNSLIAQTIPYRELLGRTLFFGWGIAVYAFILAMIIRAQIGAAISVFLIPVTVEPLLSLVLRDNQAYLPFTALNAVVISGKISYSQAALVGFGYMVVGLIIAWLLFIRRDAK